MDTWTCRCLLGVPVDPSITKMVTQGTKMEPQGLQDSGFVYKKVIHFSSKPASSSLQGVGVGVGP